MNQKGLTIFISFLLIAVGGVFSQDIITTTDSRRIEAKVIEVNIDNIKYKLTSNPDGPVYTISKSDVITILYSNSSVDVFNEEIPLMQSSKNTPANNNDAVDFLRLSDNQQEAFLKDEDPALYRRFHTAQKLGRTGKSLALVGWTFTGAGLFLMINGIVSNEEYIANLGSISFTFGQAFLLTSIPLRAVGGGLKKGVQNDYMYKYMGQNSDNGYFKLNVYGGGLGFAYVF